MVDQQGRGRCGTTLTKQPRQSEEQGLSTRGNKRTSLLVVPHDTGKPAPSTPSTCATLGLTIGETLIWLTVYTSIIPYQKMTHDGFLTRL